MDSDVRRIAQDIIHLSVVFVDRERVGEIISQRTPKTPYFAATASSR